MISRQRSEIGSELRGAGVGAEGRLEDPSKLRQTRFRVPPPVQQRMTRVGLGIQQGLRGKEVEDEVMSIQQRRNLGL